MIRLILLLALGVLCQTWATPVLVAPPETEVTEPLVVHSRVRRQFFGGRSSFPGGGFSQTAGASFPMFSNPSNSVAGFGSIAQSYHPGFGSSPITVSGGANWQNVNGNSLSGGLDIIPGVGKSAHIRGQWEAVNTPNNKLDLWGSHNSVFGPSGWNRIKQTNSIGADFKNKNNGLSITASGSQTSGMPAQATLGFDYPIIKNKDTTVSIGASRTIMQGHKPQDNIGFSIGTKF